MNASAPPRRGLVVFLGLVFAGLWLAAIVELWATHVPGDLDRPSLTIADFIPQGQVERAADYQEFLRIDALVAAVAQLLALGLFAIKGPAFVRDSAAGRIGTGMLLGMLAMGFAWLARFPFSMAALWWERRYELTEMSYLEGALNDFFSAGGTFLQVCLVLLIVMAAASRWPRRWWIAAIPTLLAVGVLGAYTGPYLMPGLERPQDRELVGDTREIAEAQNTPPPDVRVQETFGITRAPNAGATGIGSSETVILWDNLVEDLARADVRFVLAHEVAHLSRNHVWKALALLGLLAIPIGLVTTALTRRRGGLAQPEAVPLAILVVALMFALAAPLRAAHSQRLETEADWIALETTHEPGAMIETMRGFTREGLAAPEHPSWASVLLETHPSVLARIELAEAWRARHPGAPRPAPP